MFLFVFVCYGYYIVMFLDLFMFACVVVVVSRLFSLLLFIYFAFIDYMLCSFMRLHVML